MKITVNGTIKNITKTFGVIKTENFDDVFFTITNLENKNILEGDKVSFELVKSKNNRTEAIKIKLVERPKKLEKKYKQKFQFIDKNDFYFANDLIREKFSIQLKNIKSFGTDDSIFIEEEIIDLLRILDDLVSEEEPNIETIRIYDLNNFEPTNIKGRNDKKYWLSTFNLYEFANRVISLGKIESEKRKISQDYSIVWGEWRIKTRRTFHSGYHKSAFDYSYIDKGQAEQVHRYNEIPKKSYWKIRKIVQKDATFYISSAKVQEIAQSSYVPSLPPIMKVDDTAKRILDSNHERDQWQREVDTKRLLKIEQFIEESSNIVANTPMIFIKDKDYVKIEEDKERIVIDYGFLKKQDTGENKGKYIDRKKLNKKDEAGNELYQEYRPLWIIDGQHRVKGIHQSKEKELEIPIIIFPNNFGPKNTAKVFAEINTLQKKLDPLHELFMQHRFKIDHVNPKRKFKDYRSTDIMTARINWDGDDWEHSRANHLSYEIAALLASNGVLKDKVQFLPHNENKTILVKADQWVNYSRELFYRKCYRYKGESIRSIWITNPTPEEEKLSEIHIFYKEMDNYFEAWVSVMNHEEWEEVIPNKDKSWISDVIKKKGLLQNRAAFIILLEIYDLVRNKVKEMIDPEIERIITKEDFIKVLNVFKWVDWTNRDLKKVFGGGGEKPRRSLEAWMSDAILNGEMYKYDEIHNDDKRKNKSKPGRGICSYLDKPTIESVEGKVDWPTENKDLKLKSKRPFNSRYEAEWSVIDKDNNTIIKRKSSCQKYLLHGYAYFKLRYSEIKDFNKLYIQVEWSNVHTQTGKNNIEINKKN